MLFSSRLLSPPRPLRYRRMRPLGTAAAALVSAFARCLPQPLPGGARAARSPAPVVGLAAGVQHPHVPGMQGRLSSRCVLQRRHAS